MDGSTWAFAVLLALAIGAAGYFVVAQAGEIAQWARGFWQRDSEPHELEMAALRAQPLLVRTYRSSRAYQEDAQELAAYGFRVLSVTERHESRACLYVVLILLFWLIVPLILLVLLVVAFPGGTRLVVTYERRSIG
jgi:hypothetical protein